MRGDRDGDLLREKARIVLELTAGRAGDDEEHPRDTATAADVDESQERELRPSPDRRRPSACA